MNLHVITIVLNGAPWISKHLPEFEKLKTPWTWHIVHGAAASTGSTAWCNPQPPGFSRDGTSEFINSISKHPRVRLYQRQMWNGGKDEMVNTPLANIKETCCLMQIDSDEIWTAPQIDEIVSLFETLPHIYRMYFWCNYFLGPDIVATSTNGYGNRMGEWLRAFRFEPGMKWDRHEPPVLAGNSRGYSMGRDETKKWGLVFDHFAWATEKQATYKSNFYGYRNAVMNWRRLQANTHWPVKDLRTFLPWVGAGASADKTKPL